MLFLAAITGVSLIPRASGPIPERLSRFAQSLFGLHPWTLPTLLFLIGLVFLVAKRPRLTRRLGGLFLVWLTLLFAEHIHLGDVAIGREMALGLEGHGGGAVGGLVVNVWRRLLGPPGPWVGISVTAMTAFFLLSGIGPLRALEWLATSFLRAVAAVGRAMPGVTRIVAGALGALATLVGNVVAGLVAAIAALLGRLRATLAGWRAASPPVKRRTTAAFKAAAAAREVVLASGPEAPYVTASPEPLLPVAVSPSPASA
ncbi:MAG: hypothetical protein FJX78_10300, partial [Armatimonadetes bacterium]|nr:hypothetical protein [Armatimonadota bacterium]